MSPFDSASIYPVEGIDLSKNDLSGNVYSNTYNTYNKYFYQKDEPRHEHRLYDKEKPEKKEKDKELDFSPDALLFMGMGVAGLGALVIVLVSIRK